MRAERVLILATAAALIGISDRHHPTPPPKPPAASETMLKPLEQPKPTIQDTILDFLVRSINNVRERGQFNNKIDLITLPKAVMIGSAGGQRPVITPLDFPNVNLGWFIRPALDVTKPIGPYKYFIRVYNPITREIEFWALYGDSITHSGYLFFPVGTKDGWYNSFLQDGKEIEGNELFKEYLLITEDSPDGFT